MEADEVRAGLRCAGFRGVLPVGRQTQSDWKQTPGSELEDQGSTDTRGTSFGKAALHIL